MSDAVMKLLPMLDALTPDERHEVSVHLDEMDDEVLSQDEWEAAWGEEINRRIADVEAGRVQLIDSEEFMARMRDKHGIER